MKRSAVGSWSAVGTYIKHRSLLMFVERHGSGIGDCSPVGGRPLLAGGPDIGGRSLCWR